MQKKSLGILGGMGPMATSDLFFKIISMTDAEQDSDHIHIYIDNNPSIPDRTAFLTGRGEDPVPHLVKSARRLEQCGAGCIVIPCGTSHSFLPRIQAQISVPIISMVEAAAQYCRIRYPYATAGIWATRGALSAHVYERALERRGISYTVPGEQSIRCLMEIIYDYIKAGRPARQTRALFDCILHDMEGQADYFILGCTELTLAARELELPCRTVDPVVELAKAAITACGYTLRPAYRWPA